MKKNVTRIIALFVVLTMVCMSAMATYIPEDNTETISPEMSNDDEAQRIVSAIIRERMARWSSDEETEEEREIAEQFEADMFNRLKELGYEKRSYEEVCQIGSATRENVASPNAFEDLNTADEDFLVSDNIAQVNYNGQTFYCISVVVLPKNSNSVLVTNKQLINFAKTETQLNAILGVCSYFISRSVDIVGKILDVKKMAASFFFDPSIVLQNYVNSYCIEVEVTTIPKYVYISEINSSFESYYSLGLITCCLDYDETHKLYHTDINANGNAEIIPDNVYNFNSVCHPSYHNAEQVAIQTYLAGHGYEVKTPYEMMYYLDNYYIGTAANRMPLQDVYLYGLIHY